MVPVTAMVMVTVMVMVMVTVMVMVIAIVILMAMAMAMVMVMVIAMKSSPIGRDWRFRRTKRDGEFSCATMSCPCACAPPLKNNGKG